MREGRRSPLTLSVAEYIVMPKEDVTECPAHLYDGSDKLGLAQAAALPLAGLTAYRCVAEAASLLTHVAPRSSRAKSRRARTS